MKMKKHAATCPVNRGNAAVRKRKFNRRLASEIMAGKVKGRIRTRDGRPVRIVAWDARGDWPIVGLIYFDDLDTEMSWQWTKQGIAFGHSDYSTNDFALVIELKKTVLSSIARDSAYKKTKNPCYKDSKNRQPR